MSGRAETDGTPLIGFSKHSGEWNSYGSAREAKEELKKDDNYDGLSVQLLAVLDLMIKAYKRDGSAMTSKAIVEALQEKPGKNAFIHMNKTLRSLEKKGFIEEAYQSRDTPGRPAICWIPTSWALVKHVEPTF